MDLTLGQIEQIKRELATMPPAPRIRKTLSKAEAIETVAGELLALRKAGYDLKALAALLAAKGLVVAVGTLKNYLRRCGATTRKRRTKARVAGLGQGGQQDGT